MAVLNIHERALPATPAEVGALIDGLASADDRLWPHQAWPPVRYDRPLEVGAIGGHGPIRYTITHYVPGHWIRCRFTGPRGVDGLHDFAWHSEGDKTVLRHTLAIHPRGSARFSWPLVFRPLHDALLEDCLDRAEQATTGRVASPAQWSVYVRLLRWIGRRTATGRRGTPARPSHPAERS
jgi:hypothetical protein